MPVQLRKLLASNDIVDKNTVAVTSCSVGLGDCETRSRMAMPKVAYQIPTVIWKGQDEEEAQDTPADRGTRACDDDNRRRRH
jgi:hypothetical protein